MNYFIFILAILSWSLMITFITKALKSGKVNELKLNIHFYVIIISTVFLSLKSFSIIENYL